MAATGGQGQLRDEVRIEGQPVEAVLDTGAEVSLITLSAVERLLPPGAIRPFSGVIRAIGGIGSREVNQITPEVKVELEGEERTIPIWVVDDQGQHWDGAELYTGFRTVFGSYVFKRLPQGTRNAPAIFQRLMEEVIDGLPERQVAVYLDDLVIGAASQEEFGP